MAREGSGMGAEVSVRKLDEDGNVVQEEGVASSKKWAKRIVVSLFVLSSFGLWKVGELILSVL